MIFWWGIQIQVIIYQILIIIRPILSMTQFHASRTSSQKCLFSTASLPSTQYPSISAESGFKKQSGRQFQTQKQLSHSTKEDQNTLRNEELIARVVVYNEIYEIDMMSEESIRCFLNKIELNCTVPPETRASLGLVLVHKASKVNSELGELLQNQLEKYKIMKLNSIFN